MINSKSLALFICACPAFANAQTIVDNSGIGTDYQSGVMRVFGSRIDDPRSIKIRKAINGNQVGIVCGELQYQDATGKYTDWTPFMADVDYTKLILGSDPNANKINKYCPDLYSIAR